MVCYTIPTAAAVVLYFMRRSKPSLKTSQKYKTLNLLMFGGAIFGVVDHLWHGELFLVGPNMVSDLLLGITITMAILVTWGVVVYLEEIPQRSISKATS